MSTVLSKGQRVSSQFMHLRKSKADCYPDWSLRSQEPLSTGLVVEGHRRKINMGVTDASKMEMFQCASLKEAKGWHQKISEMELCKAPKTFQKPSHKCGNWRISYYTQGRRVCHITGRSGVLTKLAYVVGIGIGFTNMVLHTTKWLEDM